MSRRARSLRSLSSSRGEAGSAYIMVLLVLVVLTILGLSLSFMTQTEMQIGSNERVTTRVFYAADAAIGAALANVMVERLYDPTTFVYKDPGTVPGLDFKSTVEVSAVVPLLDSPCNLCEINNLGTYSEKPTRKVNHGYSVVATRYAGTDTKPLAQEMLSVMVEVEPWTVPNDAYKWINDPVEMAKIKF